LLYAADAATTGVRAIACGEDDDVLDLALLLLLLFIRGSAALKTACCRGPSHHIVSGIFQSCTCTDHHASMNTILFTWPFQHLSMVHTG
jgi:hypothetical protein